MEKGPEKGRRKFFKGRDGGIIVFCVRKRQSGAKQKKREYPTPAEGRTIRKEDANFSIFPEKLTFGRQAERILMCECILAKQELFIIRMAVSIL
jgi:hypothetical protein